MVSIAVMLLMVLNINIHTTFTPFIMMIHFNYVSSSERPAKGMVIGETCYYDMYQTVEQNLVWGLDYIYVWSDSQIRAKSW